MPNPTPNPRRQAAGRINGRLAAGTKSPEGRAKSARNATTHGLSSAEPTCYPYENSAALTALRTSFINCLKPADDYEMAIVEQIVDAQWRLNRIAQIEATHMDLAMQDFLATQDPPEEESFNPLHRITQLMSQMINTDRFFHTLMRYRAHFQRDFHAAQRSLLAYRKALASQIKTKLASPPAVSWAESLCSEFSDYKTKVSSALQNIFISEIPIGAGT